MRPFTREELRHRDDSDIEAAYDAADAAARLEAEAQLAQIAAPIMAAMIQGHARYQGHMIFDGPELRDYARGAARAAAELLEAVQKEI